MTPWRWFVVTPAALALCGAGGGCGSDEGGAERTDSGAPPCDCEAILASSACSAPGQQCRCDDPCNALCDLSRVECVEGTWEVISFCAYGPRCPEYFPHAGTPCCPFAGSYSCRYDACRAGEITYGTAECVGWPATWVVRGEPCPP